MPPHRAEELDDPDHFCWDFENELRLQYGATDDWYYVCSHAASNQVALVRGVAVLNTPWRSVLLLALQKLINRSANQPRNRNLLPNRQFSQLFNLLRFEPNSGEFLPHVLHRTTVLYASQERPHDGVTRSCG